jgi:hypothetical protein
MKVVAKYRAETDKGTVLFLDEKHIPEQSVLSDIISGVPFVFQALNDFKPAKVYEGGKNRVYCTQAVRTRDGMELYVSLYMNDLFRSK